MAIQLQLQVNDALYANTLASYPGVDDAERLKAWRQDIRDRARARVLRLRLQAENEAHYAKMASIEAAPDLDAS